jgi:hypothetical protein
VNIPEPARSDGSEVLFLLIGLEGRLEGSGKQLWHWTVPETDTGGLVEHTKALERTMSKELGKLLA